MNDRFHAVKQKRAHGVQLDLRRFDDQLVVHLQNQPRPKAARPPKARIV